MAQNGVTVVRVTCVECGTTKLAPDAISFDDHEYWFDHCDTTTIYPITDHRMRSVLLSIGCVYLPPITEHDITRFHQDITRSRYPQSELC